MDVAAYTFNPNSRGGRSSEFKPDWATYIVSSQLHDETVTKIEAGRAITIGALCNLKTILGQNSRLTAIREVRC